MIDLFNVVSLLQGAKKNISSDKTSYVCLAIDAENMDGMRDEIDFLIDDVIALKLDGCYTFSSWLSEHHKIPVLRAKVYQDKLKVTKLAWIDDMINEFTEI